MDIFIAIIVILAGTVIVAAAVFYFTFKTHTPSASHRNEIEARLIRKYPNASLYVSGFDQSYIVVDYESKSVILGLGVARSSSRKEIERPYEKKYAFSDIQSVDIRVDQNTISSTDKDSDGLGATVGTVVFGDPGASIIALTDPIQMRVLDKIVLRVGTNDSIRQFHEITFFSWEAESGGLRLDGFLVRACLLVAVAMEGELINAMRDSRPDLPDISDNEILQTITALKKLWRLRQEGALTDAEFHSEKRKLLGSPQ